MFNAKKKKSMKFERGKKYSYEEIKEIIDRAVLLLPDLDEDEIEVLKKAGKTEERISEFHLARMLSNMLYAAKLAKYLFGE